MKTSSIAIKWFSASVFLFVSSTVLAECVSFRTPITMDNTIPSLAGKQCSCLCTINPLTAIMLAKFKTDSGSKPTPVSACNSQATPNACNEAAASTPDSDTDPAALNRINSLNGNCYKLKLATANQKKCGCFCASAPLTGTEIIQLNNPTKISSCQKERSVCEKKDVLSTSSPAKSSNSSNGFPQPLN